MRTLWIAVSVLVLVAGLFVLLPSSPDSNADAPADVASSPLDDKVREAVRLIQEGTGNPMEAITLLREVVEEDPKHRDGLFYLGEFSRMSGQLDRALERYQTLLEYYPSDVEVATRYAETLHDLGRGAEARTFIESYTAEHNQSDVSGLTQLRDLWNEGDAEAPAGSNSLTH